MKTREIIALWVIVCAIGWLASCQNGSAADTTDDSLQKEEVNQYDSEGRRTGVWEYEEFGWTKKEHYVNGVLDGHASYSDEERVNQNVSMNIEVDFCNGDECGETSVIMDGVLRLHFTDIIKVDTSINGQLFHYRACIREYFDEGKSIRFEGVGYYEDHNGVLDDGYLGVGDWKMFDTQSQTLKTVTFNKPTYIDSPIILSLQI